MNGIQNYPTLETGSMRLDKISDFAVDTVTSQEFVIKPDYYYPICRKEIDSNNGFNHNVLRIIKTFIDIFTIIFQKNIEFKVDEMIGHIYGTFHYGKEYKFQVQLVHIINTNDIAIVLVPVKSIKKNVMLAGLLRDLYKQIEPVYILLSMKMQYRLESDNNIWVVPIEKPNIITGKNYTLHYYFGENQNTKKRKYSECF